MSTKSVEWKIEKNSSNLIVYEYCRPDYINETVQTKTTTHHTTKTQHKDNNTPHLLV